MESSIEQVLKNINSSMAPREKKDIIKLIDLIQNTPYIIKNLKRMDTKYGETILAELQLKYGGNIVDYSVFLPNRFAKLPQAQIDMLMSIPEVRFVYKGKNESGIHDISFVAIE